MDQYSLKLFLHLTESLHFGRASQACHISPSALSRQIQRMENELGHALFERDNRTVRLTRSGILLKEYAKTAQEGWQSLMEQLREEEGPLKGEISIYCSVTASLSILPDLLGTFKASYPGVNIRLLTGDASGGIQKVVEGEIDVAVSALPERLPSVLMFKTLTRTALVFIAPKGPWEFSKAMKKDIPWKTVPMILSESGLARKRVDAWFKQKRIRPNIYAQVSGNEAILSMVRLGCGLGVVPELVVENSPIRNHISILEVRPEPAPYAVGICIQKKRIKSRLVKAFWETGLEMGSNLSG